MSNAFRWICLAMPCASVAARSAWLGKTAGFEQLPRRAIGVLDVGPNALVHARYADIHGNEPDAEFMLHRGTEEDPVNLDGR